MIPLAIPRRPDYRSPVAAKSAAGFGDPTQNRRSGAKTSKAGAFFVPAIQSYGSCAWETFGSAGFLFDRFANPRTAASLRLATKPAAPHQIGAWPMIPTRNPSAIRARAAAHRQMALSALHADSSLSTRLRRYNAHMAIARDLEAQGVTHGQR